MPDVPRLADLCKRVLKANVASLQDVGDVPYEFLADVLPGCRVDQLREIEDLSPQIAEEDEEIWEMFFKRDFPLVAESRATSLPSSSKSILHPHASTSARKLGEDDHNASLFTSYRDLYYDEQVRREERLASAGTRLKERIANIAQRKQERRTILDPRLGLNDKKRRARRVGPVHPQMHWSQREYKPKTLAEKARIKAGSIAFAYHPPRSTRASTVAVNYAMDSSKGKEAALPSRPSYKEEEEDMPSVPVKTGTKRSSTASTRFVERTVNVPKKSSIDRPYRVVNGQLALSSPALPPPPKPVEEAVILPIPPEPEAPKPRKAIPGITRRPKPVSLEEEKAKFDPSLATATSIQLPSHPLAIHSLPTPASSISPPASMPDPPFFGARDQHWRPNAASPSQLSPPLYASSAPPLPMLAPAQVKRPVPNMFIPRKKIKPAQ